MAPALTEPLSQTNKLSSSATSASPRPSSNNLISESETVPTTVASSADSNHRNNITSSNSDPSDTSLFIAANNKTSQEANFPFRSNGKNGTFQSAFEQFQQIRQLQQNHCNDSPPRVITNKSVKLSTGRRQRSAVRSPINGRLSNSQMGPMCDTNIEFQDNNSINSQEEFNSEEKEHSRIQDHNAQTHMDYSVSDGNINTEIEDDVPTLKQSGDIDKEQQDIGYEIVERNDELNDSQSSQDRQENKIQDDEPGIKNSEYENRDQPLQSLDEIKQKTPPRTPSRGTSTTNQSQSESTPVSSLTPQSTTSGMGLQKDFIKDTAEMEQVLGELGTSDMDLLQVLKGFDTTPGGEGAFCELSLFTDVDVMNYEEVGMQQPKDAETREIRNEIEKRQQQMQRKCDFLVRRLRKIQAYYMGKHTSEEVAGLFEWQANPTLRRKEPGEPQTLNLYEDDKRRQISTAVMKSFVRRIKTAADQQHSSLIVKRNKVGRPSNASLQAELSGTQNKSIGVSSVVPLINEKMVEEISHVSGHLHSELKEIHAAIDSDVTASSSGGESADEMQQFNNTMQQNLSISKRAAWRWVRDRAAIASRWTWLLAQISDLEYRIRQHNELHHQIKKNKGVVSFEKCTASTTPSSSTILPSSVNGFRGVLPGNSKALDADMPTSSAGGSAPNGAYSSGANNSSGSCRTQAFQRTGFRKRKLLQTANVHTVSKKAARSSTVKCGCQWPLHPCGLCTGRPDPTAPRDLPDTMTSSERVGLLDPGFHPVLSFPEDVSQSIHFEATMRLPEWQTRAIRCASKNSSSSLKGAISMQKGGDRDDRSRKYVDSRRKYNRKYPQDIMAANKLKNAKVRRSLHGDQCNNHLVKSKHRKLISSSLATASGLPLSVGAGSSSGGGGGMSSAASSIGGSDSFGVIDSLDTSNGQLPRSKNASPTPGCHGSSIYKSERMDRRHRNSYDIDNIVIPYSVAATTRVEILPYKEIPTPKWRIIDESSEITDSSCQPQSTLENSGAENSNSHTDELTSNVGKTNSSNRLEDAYSNDDEFEDTSDEAILIRHERALIEERKKFQTYLKYPWSTRSRANRRTDSRAESSGANTPDPSSPAPNTPIAGGDQESVPSPTTPLSSQVSVDAGDENSTGVNNHPVSNNSNSTVRKIERRRTASGRKEREHSKDDLGSYLFSEVKEFIPPYEPLEFPLPDDVYGAMLELMPHDHQILDDCVKSNDCDGTTSVSICSEEKLPRSTVNDEKVLRTGDREERHILITTNSQYIRPGDSGGPGTGTGFVKSSNQGYSGVLDIESNDREDSDTDSAESGMPDEDPNDPEWREPE